MAFAGNGSRYNLDSEQKLRPIMHTGNLSQMFSNQFIFLRFVTCLSTIFSGKNEICLFLSCLGSCHAEKCMVLRNIDQKTFRKAVEMQNS